MSRRALIPALLWILAACALAQEDYPSVLKIEKHINDSQYESWIEPYRQGPLQAKYYDPQTSTGRSDPALIKVVIIEGDEKPPDNHTAEHYGPRLQITLYGTSVSDLGVLSGFEHDGMGFKGGGTSVLSEEDRTRLAELARNLPDDRSQLPPKGRRIVIQTGHPRDARVYDRTHLPGEVREILRLMRIDLHPS
jgi:hypothetical protein